MEELAGHLDRPFAHRGQFPPESGCRRLADDPCLVKLNLGSYRLELEGRIAHFRCFTRQARCGVAFNFPDVETQKAYLQLLEPIMIGATLAPVESKPDPTGLHREQYAGKNAALLTVWRQAPGGEVASFDFRMNRYGVRWRTGLAELIPYQLEEQKPAGTRPVLRLKMRSPEKQDERPPELPLTEAQEEEVRWLFVLSISNLSASMPADLRVFFTALVVT